MVLDIIKPRQRVAHNEVIMEVILSRCDRRSQARCLRVNQLFFRVAGAMVYRQFHFFNDYVWRQEFNAGAASPPYTFTFNLKDKAAETYGKKEMEAMPAGHRDLQRHLLRHVKVFKDSVHNECSSYRGRFVYLCNVQTLQYSANITDRDVSHDCPEGNNCPVLNLHPSKLVLRNLLFRHWESILERFAKVLETVDTVSFVFILSDINKDTSTAIRLARSLGDRNKNVRIIFADHQKGPGNLFSGSMPTKKMVIDFLVAVLTTRKWFQPPRFDIYFLQHHHHVSTGIDEQRLSPFSYLPEIITSIRDKVHAAFQEDDETVMPDIFIKTASEYAVEGVDDELEYDQMEKLRAACNMTTSKRLDRYGPHSYVVQTERLPLVYRV